MEVTFDLFNGAVLIEGTVIALDHFGEISPKINGNFRQIPGSTTEERDFQSDRRFSLLSTQASIAIVADARKITSLCILFDDIIFFEKTLLESKIIERFERKYGIHFDGDSRSVAEIGKFSWGEGAFHYDHRQGDLSLCFSYVV
jgi:hypothetical protein